MKYVLMLLGFLTLLIVAIALEPQKFSPPATPEPATLGSVLIGSTTVAVEIADTYEARMQGLSGRSALPQGSGMLFVFEREGEWGIWMKDMQFSIDIIWADTDGRVVSVAHKVSPETYPNAFYPAKPARYVLEVPAGFAASRGIVEGVSLVVQ